MTAERKVEFSPRDRVIDEMRQFLLRHEVDEVELGGVRGLATLGLGLRDKFSLEINAETDQVMVEQVSRSIYLASKQLDLPMPDKIDFIKGKQGIPDSSIKDGDYYRGSNVVNEYFPNGLIAYSPYFLKMIADCIEGVPGNPSPHQAIHALVEVSAHEVFHTHQRKKYSQAMAREDEQAAELENRGETFNWENLMTERGARAFADRFAVAYYHDFPLKL